MTTTVRDFNITTFGHDSVYANGRQQLPISISLEKRVGGTAVRLSQREIDSIHILQRVGGPVPGNWSLSVERNQFSHGLWNRHGRSSDEEIDSSHEEKISDGVSSIEIFSRYLQCGMPAQSIQIMAAIEIEGLGLITSVGNFGPGMNFTSWVQVRGVPPFVLNANELISHSEHVHWRSNWAGHQAETWISYWDLPSGLEIKNQVVTSSSDGQRPRWNGLTEVFNTQRRISVLLDREVQALSVGLIRRDASHNHYRVPLRSSWRTIRALMDYNNYHASIVMADRQLWFFVWDNFGCEHRFGIRQQGNNHFVLSNG